MQFAYLEKITRKFGKKRLTGAVFPDMAKAFNTVWVDGFLRNFLNFASYLVHTISYFRGRTFQASFQMALSSWYAGWGGVGWFSPVPFNMYVKDLPTSSHHVKLPLYADKAIITTSHNPTLFLSYMESCERPATVVE